MCGPGRRVRDLRGAGQLQGTGGAGGDGLHGGLLQDDVRPLHAHQPTDDDTQVASRADTLLGPESGRHRQSFLLPNCPKQ